MIKITFKPHGSSRRSLFVSTKVVKKKSTLISLMQLVPTPLTLHMLMSRHNYFTQRYEFRSGHYNE